MNPKVLERLLDTPVQTDEQGKPTPLPDLLNHQKVAKNVIQTINHSGATESPCIAIFGPWGTGKTGILNLIRRKLDPDKYVWQYLDAWHNQRNDLVILELLRELFGQAGPEFSGAFLRLLSVFSSYAGGLVVDPFLPEGAKSKDMIAALQKGWPAGIPSSREQLIKSEFQKVVKKLTENGKTRLVLAIDNLDRCSPEAALHVLETLFLITHVPHCAFIVAADQQVLVSFLNREYKGTDFSGTKFLEKVFPYYFRVPDPWVAWEHSQAEGAEDEILALLEYLLEAKNPWREDEPTFQMVWHYFSQPRALRNPRRIKRILRRVANYKFDDADLEKFEHSTLSENLLFLVILSDLWPQALEFYMTTDAKSWRKWLDYMADPQGTQPLRGVLIDDPELQDFLYQVKQFNDGTFDDTIIGDQKKLWYYLEDIAELGL